MSVYRAEIKMDRPDSMSPYTITLYRNNRYLYLRHAFSLWGARRIARRMVKDGDLFANKDRPLEIIDG